MIGKMFLLRIYYRIRYGWPEWIRKRILRLRGFDGEGWLAFRMSGFGGLVVPEKVAWQGSFVWVFTADGQYRKTRGVVTSGGHCRNVGIDGSLHKTYKDCVKACNEANRNNTTYAAELALRHCSWSDQFKAK